MDIMQIKSTLMRSLISKLISKVILEKLGYKVKVSINDIDLKINDEQAVVKINAGLEMNIDELKSFEKLIDN